MATVVVPAAPPPLSPSLSSDDEKRAAETDTELRTRHYEPPDSYESKHRWDPDATWTPEEEKRLYRRVGA